MNVFAYCMASARDSVRRMAGVEPALSPPLHSTTFNVGWLEYRDLLMFKLHGLRGESYWLGDRGAMAMMGRTLREAHLNGAVIFAANCWLPQSPMLQACFDAGASVVIGGSGVNYGGRGRMQGSDILGLYFRVALERGASPALALEFAKMRLRVKWPTLAVQDTLGFELFSPG